MTDRSTAHAVVLGMVLLILAAPAPAVAVECASRRCSSMVSPSWALRMGEAARSLYGGQPAIVLVLGMTDRGHLGLAAPAYPAAALVSLRRPEPIRLALLDLPPPTSR